MAYHKVKSFMPFLMLHIIKVKYLIIKRMILKDNFTPRILLILEAFQEINLMAAALNLEIIIVTKDNTLMVKNLKDALNGK